MAHLEKIENPRDVRGLSTAELKELSEEIRQLILEVVSQNSAGGHLASSLGAVELTVALHKVFNTPQDKIIWDVGHQGYPHKLLTGRCRNFNTLRKTNGISGFLRRCESEYDVFGAGHAGTSISAALGMAQARDIKGEDFKVVAVIGDGSMTCGLPFEGLNNAGHTETDLLVILNDNEMSISENVGALSKYFNWLVQNTVYNKTKKEAKQLVERAPLGEKVVKLVHRIEESAKGLIVPSIFFEDLGFRYIGPIDGHDMDELTSTLEKVRDFKGPILLHALTRKGKGYKLAEGDAVLWHAPGNFQVDTGEIKKSSAVTYTHVYGNTLLELAEQDKRVVALTAAMATGTGLVAFGEKYPKRYFDVGIAEAHAVTSAAGMAAEGLRPFVTIYSTFLQRGYDSIVHDVALQNLPVIFAMDRAGVVGFDGPTHHGLLDIAYMRIVPNMVVMAPKDGTELRDMMLTAKNHMSGPIAFRYPRGAAEVDATKPAQEIEIGKAEMIHDSDGQVAILSYGHVYPNVMAAADELRKENIDVAVINARFVKPLDSAMLTDVAARFPVIFSVEDGSVTGGFGSAVNELFVSKGIPAQCKMLGTPDEFIDHGDQATQQDFAGISAAKIAQSVRKAIVEYNAKAPSNAGSRVRPIQHVSKIA